MKRLVFDTEHERLRKAIGTTEIMTDIIGRNLGV
jgi:hypothetical protein